MNHKEAIELLGLQMDEGFDESDEHNIRGLPKGESFDWNRQKMVSHYFGNLPKWYPLGMHSKSLLLMLKHRILIYIDTGTTVKSIRIGYPEQWLSHRVAEAEEDTTILSL